jgi:hypothetical protein
MVRTRPARGAGWLVALVAVGAGGCILDPGRSTNQLDRAMALWTSHHVASYRLVIQRLCFCLTIDPVRVTVTNGQVVSRLFTTTGQPVPANLAEFYPDIPGLFEWVRRASAEAATVTVTFDEDFGFPTSAVVDWIKNAVDDEVTVRTSEFATTQ